MEKIYIDDVLERIFIILEKRNETKKELADAVEIRYQSLVDWRLRGTIPAADVLFRIANHLGVTMEYLLNGGDQIPDDIAIADSYLKEIPTDKRGPVIAMIKSQYDYWNDNPKNK